MAVRGGPLPAAAAARLAAPLGALVRAALAAEGCRPGEVAVVLGGDRLLRDLNRRYRGLDRATDVLSFDYGPAGDAVEGDLAISIDRTLAQARRYRATPGGELARLVVHGALHLAGLDHRTAAERRAMRAREDAVLGTAAAAVRRLERILPAARGRRRMSADTRPRAASRPPGPSAR